MELVSLQAPKPVRTIQQASRFICRSRVVGVCDARADAIVHPHIGLDIGVTAPLCAWYLPVIGQWAEPRGTTYGLYSLTNSSFTDTAHGVYTGRFLATFEHFKCGIINYLHHATRHAKNWVTAEKCVSEG